ncbi:WbqC family protein [Leifsonia bigeumensis]|uniref:WbqC family protein n=1 Tax=Leifsonella bigeumensis TaxID=433643 RepID=A0ABP7FFQ1_9MICO
MQGLQAPVVVIHQPYFLPWLGYFAKLALADTVVILDDVLFRKRFFIDRARIIDVHSEIKWIGLPVGENFKVPINQVVIQDVSFLDNMIQTVRSAYRRSPLFVEEMNWVDWALRESIKAGRSLVEVDVELLLKFCDRLQIRRPAIDFSSSHRVRAEPTERLLDLLQIEGGRTFLIGSGSSAYVHDLALLVNAGIGVVVQDFLPVHPVYRQVRRQQLPFAAGLSVIDVLMNVGHIETQRLLEVGILDSKYVTIHSVG